MLPQLDAAEQARACGCVAAVDIGGTNLRVALADGSGVVFARWAGSTVGMRSAERVVALMEEGVRALLRETGRTQSDLGAMGVGAPGVTNAHTGVVMETSYLMGWRDVPLRAMLAEKFGVPVAVDNDVNLAALGEGWLGAGRGCANFVFIAIGSGVGAGIVVEGKLLRGTHWLAGEIGYMLVPGVEAAEEAKPGEPGALEKAIGGEGIRAQWRRLALEGESGLAKELCATEIFDLAEQTHAGPAQALLDRTARMLAAAIYNISLVLDCPLFLFGGAVGGHRALLGATRGWLSRLGAAHAELQASSLGTDAQLLGAVRLALDLAGRGAGAGVAGE